MRIDIPRNKLPSIVPMLSLCLFIVMLIPNPLHAEHNSNTQSFQFSGTTPRWEKAINYITLPYDGIIFLQLLATSVPGECSIGYYSDSNECYIPAARFEVSPPTIGQVYGPYYVKAGKYEIYFKDYSQAFVSTVSYTIKATYRRQLMGNDQEPNDFDSERLNLGSLSANMHITGHLGYENCQHDKEDYFKFRIVESGEYYLKIHYDSDFATKPKCSVSTYLDPDLNSSWPQGIGHNEPTGIQMLGPISLTANTDIGLNVKLGHYCTEIDFTNEISPAGAYDIQLYDPSQPPPVTLKLKDVEEASKALNQRPNQKYLIVDIENFGVEAQSGSIEITVDLPNGQKIFSDKKDFSVSASTTKRIDLFADTSTWPTAALKATVDLYSYEYGKKQHLGTRTADFACWPHKFLPGTVFLLNQKNGK